MDSGSKLLFVSYTQKRIVKYQSNLNTNETQGEQRTITFYKFIPGSNSFDSYISLEFILSIHLLVNWPVQKIQYILSGSF